MDTRVGNIARAWEQWWRVGGTRGCSQGAAVDEIAREKGHMA